jgi:hypothetical protein
VIVVKFIPLRRGCDSKRVYLENRLKLKLERMRDRILRSETKKVLKERGERSRLVVVLRLFQSQFRLHTAVPKNPRMC